jgi:membrane protease YdiL (CAAX protease family)
VPSPSPRTPLILAWIAAAGGGSTAAGLVLWLAGDALGDVGRVVVTALTMFTPLLATLLVQRLSGERLLRGVGARPRLSRWLLVASALGLAVALGATAVGFLLPGVQLDSGVDGLISRVAPYVDDATRQTLRAQLDALPVHPALLMLPQAAIAGFTVNALFAFGEEIGWRGWLWRELRGLGFWKANLAIGGVWGLWHAPLILNGHNYPDHPLPGIALFTVICALLSPLHSWVRERSGTTWAAAVLHGTMNATAGLTLLVTAGGTDLLVGLPGLAGVLALLALLPLVWLDLRRAPLAA